MCAWRQTARGGDPSTPSSATRVADQLGGGLAAPLMQSARGGDPRTPRRPLAHLFLGVSAPHVALRASLPLFWPPPPCPCRAAAGLLRCCLCLLVNVDTLPCPLCTWCLATTSLGACNVLCLLGDSDNWLAGPLSGCCLRVGSPASGARRPPASCPRGHLLLCASPAHLRFLALPWCFVPVTVMPVSQHPLVKVPAPMQSCDSFTLLLTLV